MNYEVAIKKPFTDLGKLAIGILLSLLPIVDWIARGFTIECSGLGKNKTSKNMPEWKDVWYYFVKGLASYIIAIVYTIPAMIVFSVSLVYALGSFAALSGMMPAWNSAFSEQIFRDWAMQSLQQFVPVVLSIAPMLVLGVALLVVGLYLYPIGVLNYLKTKKFEKAFEMEAIKAIAVTKSYFLAWISVGLISIAINAVGSLIPVIGSSAAFFVSGVIAWDIFGQIFRKK